MTDGSVVGDLIGRHHIGHRRQIPVDPRIAQLAPPALPAAAQLGVVQLRLLGGRGDGGETGPAELLHQAALLVGGDQQRDPAGGGILQLLGLRLNSGQSRCAITQQDHRPIAAGADLGDRLIDIRTGHQHGHVELADLLGQAQPLGVREALRRRIDRRRTVGGRGQARRREGDRPAGSDRTGLGAT
ncbi:hypothetical protein SDC9_149284 [bioreactor metagenome]|uniref:Uncharacterized protein n=1 Tax=bioreactor metagenome TaxID=1076179 RepID=A0A645EJC8_9ZZZZ